MVEPFDLSLSGLIGSRLFGYLHEVDSDLIAQLHDIFLGRPTRKHVARRCCVRVPERDGAGTLAALFTGAIDQKRRIGIFARSYTSTCTLTSSLPEPKPTMARRMRFPSSTSRNSPPTNNPSWGVKPPARAGWRECRCCSTRRQWCSKAILLIAGLLQPDPGKASDPGASDL